MVSFLRATLRTSQRQVIAELAKVSELQDRCDESSRLCEVRRQEAMVARTKTAEVEREVERMLEELANEEAKRGRIQTRLDKQVWLCIKCLAFVLCDE
jgi:hypothetical protein